jgi:hypothetical protein
MNARKRLFLLITAVTACLLLAAHAAAQSTGPTIVVPKGSGLQLVVDTGPGPTQQGTVTPDSNTGEAGLTGVVAPDNPHTRIHSLYCKKDGKLYFYAEGRPIPCWGFGERVGDFYYDTPNRVVITGGPGHWMLREEAPGAAATGRPRLSGEADLFGGSIIVDSNHYSYKFGADFAVPITIYQFSLGPEIGFENHGRLLAQSLGGGPPPSTFEKKYFSSLDYDFGGRFELPPLYDFKVGLDGGAVAAQSTIIENAGFCGGSAGPTGGCITSVSNRMHSTIWGYEVGADFSYPILRKWPDVNLEFGYRYERLNDSGIDFHISELRTGIQIVVFRH